MNKIDFRPSDIDNQIKHETDANVPPTKVPLCITTTTLSQSTKQLFILCTWKKEKALLILDGWDMVPKKIRDWDSHINGLAKISSPSDHKRENKELKFFTFQGFKRGPWDLHFHLAYLSSFLIASGQDSGWFKMNFKTINWQMREKVTNKIISISAVVAKI